MTPAEPPNPVLDSRNRLKLGLFCTNMVPSLTTAPSCRRLPGQICSESLGRPMTSVSRQSFR